MLSHALAILQGAQQLQTWNVGKQAGGYGSRAKWSRLVAGTTLFVNASTGSLISAVANDPQALNALGSASLPFASLEEALLAMSAPTTELQFDTPRTVYLGPGEYTVGSQVIRRSFTFIMDQAAVITDLVSVLSSNEIANGSVLPIVVQFIAPGGVGGGHPELLPGGIDVGTEGTATRAVGIHVQGIGGVVVTVESGATTGVTGGLFALNSGVELHAPAPHGHGPFRLEARSSTLEGTTLEASEVHAWDCLVTVPTIVCDGTTECRLYSTELRAGAGTWTGGTLHIDGATNFDWVADGWTKANPGGVAPIVMV